MLALYTNREPIDFRTGEVLPAKSSVCQAQLKTTPDGSKVVVLTWASRGDEDPIVVMYPVDQFGPDKQRSVIPIDQLEDVSDADAQEIWAQISG